MQTTYVPKKGEIESHWHLIDATDKVLGRLCTEVARHLIGKTKPQYTPHTDTGDHVIVINAGQIKLTGNKSDDKIYYHHSGYPGGIRAESAGKRRATRPERLIMASVKGMLPKTKLGRAMLKKLRVYGGDAHPHQGQMPKPLEIQG